MGIMDFFKKGAKSKGTKKSLSNDDKLERLSKMIDEMQKENEEKFLREGDQQAGQKLANLAYFKEKMESKCEHDWVTDYTGHYYCSKCGEDGGSAWDC